MLRKLILFSIVSSILTGATFLFATETKAEQTREPLLKIVDPTSLAIENSFLVFDEEFKGGGTVAVGDLGGDGVPEIIVGAGAGGGPQIRIFRLDGSAIKSFYAYPENFTGGVEVTTGDLDGDGIDEIITAPGFKGGPQIRIFDGLGNIKFNPGFFAFHTDYRGGVHLTACDTDGNGQDEIVVGTGYNSQPHVRVFNRYGKYTGTEYRPFSENHQGGVSVACANVDGGIKEELVMGVNSYDQALVKVYKNDRHQTVLGEFLAFPETFKGGVNLTGGDIDGDGFDEIIVAANSGGGPHVRTYEAYGKELRPSFFAYEEDFRGGVHIAAANVTGSPSAEVFTLPSKQIAEGRVDIPQYIEVNLAEQKLMLYENGIKTVEYTISSGKPGMDTPTGTYHIMNKAPLAYSAPYALWMPNWMGFTSQGHGLHGLPFWRLRGGGVYYEGENHLGLKVSHGCVRLPVPGSKVVFERVSVGTPIFIY
ncbi:L,D-transpeptidase family protein [Patescibacteria group bacterium]|nr:L,D-transpeptidase family protein [Patescibacteria group bacterium]MBU1890383.1 L,D-transpeptidase family protein [Patescibacteria group bacterium]